jgi:Skp1 family, tetramerisation domain
VASEGTFGSKKLETAMAESGSPAPVELLLKSKDGEIFKVEKSIAMQINFVKGMLEGSFRVSLFGALYFAFEHERSSSRKELRDHVRRSSHEKLLC